ncbi:unnamed protein product [Cladocopium goreaui]|uniref:Cyclic nucleotide-binding domain-containing protein n=1 Tax=Cladocopium goreaui TaxID=2562237 RepID=A0A9P1D310_9DINO|nr:unnamed protein product [Cladocopium goreaui]|mmetsp:Transcript_5989/g.13635  ORF Transcript_5989/g.13635 Transcript_5989/m.13635 type:complete len:271 (+) Transcript_5989:48-860(+)
MAASMAHVPKRAVQHCLYTPLQEVHPPCLKPGQAEQIAAAEAAEAKKKDAPLPPFAKLFEDSQIESEYVRRMCKLRCPDDFKTPRGDKKADHADDHSCQIGVAHWRSEYAHNSAEGGSRRVQPQMTAQQILASRKVPTPRCCISKLQSFTCNHAEYGRNGDNPRDKVTPRDTQMPVLKNSLTAGSTRGTTHIPGYQGVIPRYAGSESHMRASATPRSVDKTNIIPNFHKDIVGYAGHVPEAVCNDLGGRKPTDLTTFGHDFKPHKTGALR